MRESIIGLILVAIIFAIIAAPVVALQYLWFFPSEKDTTILVNEKWTKTDNQAMYYLVSDDKGNVYKITDDYWYMKFNSSDQYAMIQAGKKYNVKTCGWRTPFLSEYPNIIAISPA